MLTSVEGVYEDGVIKLAEQPVQVPSGAPVIVTFLPCG
jgi:predicted DNA-binding antitoxin AbrB/MazE fold protein